MRRLGSWFEADAATDWRDYQVKWLVLQVTTLVDEVLRRLMLEPYLDQLLSRVGRVMLTKVGTETAVSVMNLDRG